MIKRLVLLVLALAPTGLAAQATGRIVGTVRTNDGGAPLGEVQVFLARTGLGTLTRANGGFVLVEVPAGAHELRAERIGMAAIVQAVTVAAGQTVELDLRMTVRALGLDEIVVTGAAGAARRREIGSTIDRVVRDEVTGAIDQPIELLQAAAAGVQVTKDSGVLGGGYNVRLRGNTSVALSNQPIVYVDGIRIQSKPFPIGRATAALTSGLGGGVQANALNSLNPDDIERIEVIKGAAATTLYGTEASAGVIQVFTRRGPSSAPAWSFEARHGLAHAVKIGPHLFPYHRLEPYLRWGSVGAYSASVRGGDRALRYFTSGGYEGGVGILPQDTLGKWTVRGNFTLAPASGVELQWNTGYANTRQRSTPQGANASGITVNAYRGQGNYFASEDPAVVGQLFAQEIRQQIERFTTGGTATYAPLPSLTTRLSIGYDSSQQEVRALRPFGFVFFTPGSVFNDTWQNRLLTFDFVGTYSLLIRGGVRSSFSWGGQATGEDERRVDAYGEGFPGAADPTVSSAATNVAEENRSKVWNAGFFVQNVFDVANRYFLTLGMRVDGNSAFGDGFGLQIYPKASASWVLSDERFWRPSWGSLKLRAAFGRSGRAPGAFDATRTWVSIPWGGNPALVPSTLGDPDIGPEVTTEVEGGADGEWLDGRVAAAFTYFTQTTTDALFSVAPVPSSGFSLAQRTNVGELRNWGAEMSLEGAPIRTARWALELGTTVATHHSRVESLGGNAPFATGGGWIEKGLPVPVIRTRYMRNGDRILNGTPIPCTAAAAVQDPTLPCIDLNHVYGPAQPTKIVSPSARVRIPRGITLAARGEYRGGMYVMESNFTQGGVSRAAWMPACWSFYTNPYDGTRQTPAYAPPSTAYTLALEPGTPARYVAMCSVALGHEGYSTIRGDYFKLRSLSVQAPLDVLFPGRVRSAVLTVAANNAFRWLNSEWRVGDPEMGIPVDGLVSGGPTSTPPPTWSLHASVRVQF